MKKLAMVMAVVVAAVFIAGLVFAFECCGYSDKGDKDHSKAKGMKEEMKKELGLTAEQDKRLKAGKEAHRTEAKALRAAMKAKKEELRAAIAKPGATRAGVEPIVIEIKALEARMTDNRVNGIFSVKSILTPAQSAKLESMREKCMKEWKEKCKAKGPRKGM